MTKGEVNKMPEVSEDHGGLDNPLVVPMDESTAAPIRVRCPHCSAIMDCRKEIVDRTLRCPLCRQQFRVPLGRPTPPPPPPLVRRPPMPSRQFVHAEEVYSPPSSIVVPLLIAAISNVFMSMLLLYTVLLFFLAVPLVVLCIFEFRLYAQMDRLSPQQLATRASNLAVFEILAFLLSPPAAVCGIITFINAGKLSRKVRHQRSLPRF